MSDYISHSLVKIRKARKCYGCTQAFPIGTAMHRVVHKDGGIFATYWCQACQDYIERLAKEDPHAVDEGFSPGEIAEYRALDAAEAANGGGA